MVSSLFNSKIPTDLYPKVIDDDDAVSQVEKQRVGLQHELDDLSQRLDEAGGATQAQVTFYMTLF